MKPATRLYLLLAIELIALSVFQLPAIADFQKFAFYDEGATLHVDALYSSGLRPTIDFGYSYGLLSLLVAHGWFAVWGRTPYAYLALVNLLNLMLLWPLAQLSVAGLQRTRGGGKPGERKIPMATWVLAIVLLPHAIFPTNYSITHPLEALLLAWALLAYLRGYPPAALACATVAIFVKPTMAYVLGLLLVIAALYEIFRGRRPVTTALGKLVLPGLLTTVLCLAIELLFFGLIPTLHNILPLTGGRSYAAMNFGLFRAGKEFWLPTLPTGRDYLHHYLFTPAAFWIAGTLILFAAGFGMGIKMPRRGPPHEPAIGTLLPLLAILHATFMFGFYAWSGSWTYYSWLLYPALMSVVAEDWGGVEMRRGLQVGLLILAPLALADRMGDAVNRWRYTTRSAETAGLFVFPDLLGECQRARALPPAKTLFLINGCLREMAADVRTPPSWFLSPAIPTPPEIAAIRRQIAGSDYVILVNDYGRAEAWRWPEFATEQKEFITQWKGHYLTILERATDANPSPVTAADH